jgi:hypothetical protein
VNRISVRLSAGLDEEDGRRIFLVVLLSSGTLKQISMDPSQKGSGLAPPYSLPCSSSINVLAFFRFRPPVTTVSFRKLCPY